VVTAKVAVEKEVVVRLCLAAARVLEVAAKEAAATSRWLAEAGAVTAEKGTAMVMETEPVEVARQQRL
jgi:hypothetical protein